MGQIDHATGCWPAGGHGCLTLDRMWVSKLDGGVHPPATMKFASIGHNTLLGWTRQALQRGQQPHADGKT